MSDIRFNQWLHQSGTGGVSQDHIGNIGIGTTNPSIVVSAANTAVLNVGVITANNLFVNNAFNGDITGNVTGNISGATGTFSGNVDIADKIIHTGDTDTAMRFPADNTFAVDTAGSERLRITSAGKVGINQSTWSGKDHIFEVKQGTNNKEIARFSVNGGDGNVQGKGSIGLSVFNSTTYPHVSIGVEEDGTGNYQGHLTFATRSAGSDSAPTERLRITSGGDVGIGDNAPNSNYGTNLSVHSTATDGARLKLSDGTTGKGNTDGFDLISTGGVAYILNRENADMSFSTNNTERLRITSGGDMGLGTASPTARLDVRRGDTNGKIAEFHQSTGYGIQIRSSESVATIRSEYNQALVFETGTTATERLRITTDGKLGHGTASPSSAFHGTVSSGGYGATFESTANGGESVVTIKGKKSDGTVRSAIFKYDNSDMIRLGTSQSIPMRFETSDTERLRISADGYVTKPNQPRFFATLSATYTGYNGQNTGGTWIAYNNTIYNVGGGFQTSGSDLGLFVAPVSGLYLFHAAAYKGTTTGDWTQSWFNVNSSRANGTDFVHSSGTRFAQNAIQVYMTAGQKIGFHPYNNLTNNEIRSTGNHTWFKGCLLG